MSYVSRWLGTTLVVCLAAISGVNAQFSRPAVPPIAPSDLAAVVSGSTVMLTWTAPPDTSVTGFSLEAAIAAAGPAIAVFPLNESHLTVSDVPDGTYFVRVRALNQDGAGATSNEVIVVVGTPACTSPPLPPTGLAAQVNGTGVSLQWQAPGGGCAPTQYILQAGSAPTLADIVVAPMGLSTAIATVAPAGTYYVRVLAINTHGQSAPSNEVVVDLVSTCVAPGAPLGFTTTSSSSTAFFHWSSPVTGDLPMDYLLEAGSTPSASDLAVVPIAGLAFSTPAPPGTYFVRVRGRNACGIGPASETRQLVVICPSPGTPSTPSTNVFGSTATLAWTGVAGATSYRLEVGSAAGASNVFAGNMAALSRQLSGLAAGTYFARVQALNACGSGPSSGEAIFTIAGQPAGRTCNGAAVPSSAPCGTPSARCNDGTFSCSQNRSGTCSSHGGVSCWVCPGPLC